jgi:hypothetical protein
MGECMSSTHSAQTTVYTLRKRFPRYLWDYYGRCIYTLRPSTPGLYSFAQERWKSGCIERDQPVEPIGAREFIGDPIEEAREELGDFYNYILVAGQQNRMNSVDELKLLHATEDLYNLFRLTFDVEPLKVTNYGESLGLADRTGKQGERSDTALSRFVRDGSQDPDLKLEENS